MISMPTSPTPAPPHAPRGEVRPGWWLDGRRALFVAEARLLVVADVHWGYVEAHRAAGHLLPDWGDAEIAARLRGLIADWAPRRMLWLGDSLHAPGANSAAEAFLASLPPDLETIVLAGNHDRGWARAHRHEWNEAGARFHHGNDGRTRPGADSLEIVGHHHPAFVWNDGAGNAVKLPAAVIGPHRWVLPAFSPWAGGVPWNDRLTAEEKLWVLAPTRVFVVSSTVAAPARSRS
jgi:metallophosphoesterase superfamily enzyme